MRRVAWRLARVIVLLSVAGIGGCVVPVAVWVQPRVGVGQQVEFVDEAGHRSEVDGVALISWGEFWLLHYSLYLSVEGSPSNHIARVRNGMLQVPTDWTIRVFEVAIPHPWAGMAVGGHFSALFTNLPAPYFDTWVQPHESIHVLPLIAGHSPVITRRHEAEFETSISRYSEGIEKWDRKIALFRHSDDPAESLRYWNDILARLRLRRDKAKFDDRPDLRLPPRQYAQVKAFVEEEIQIIERMIERDRAPEPADEDMTEQP